MFRFHEGQYVAIKDDQPGPGLKSGDTGRIWTLYDTDPQLYESTFTGADGEPFGMTVQEREIEANAPQCDTSALDASLSTVEFPVWSPFDAYEAAATLHEFLHKEKAIRTPLPS